MTHYPQTFHKNCWREIRILIAIAVLLPLLTAAVFGAAIINNTGGAGRLEFIIGELFAPMADAFLDRN